MVGCTFGGPRWLSLVQDVYLKPQQYRCYHVTFYKDYILPIIRLRMWRAGSKCRSGIMMSQIPLQPPINTLQVDDSWPNGYREVSRPAT